MHKNEFVGSGKFRFTLDMDKDLYEELRNYSSFNGRSMKAVVCKLLDKYLNTKELEDAWNDKDRIDKRFTTK